MQDKINFECYMYDLYLQFCQHDAAHSDRLKRYRNIEPESAQFLFLLDAERDAYVDYWQHLTRLIHPKGGLLVVDNVLSHAAQVQDFMSLVKRDGRFVSSTIHVGAGLCLIGYR